MFFLMKELREAILSQNHWRRKGGGPGRPGPLNRNSINDKNLTKQQKALFLHFQFFSAFLRTTVINNKLH